MWGHRASVDRGRDPGRARSRELARLALIGATLLALLLTSSALALATPVRAAEEPPPKAVIVVGPTHGLTSRNLAAGRKLANAAEAQGMDVRRLFHPNATKKRVKKHAQGAQLFAYIGHGNGWPSPFGPFQEKTKNGLGLNPLDESKRTTGNVKYFGADWLKEKIRLSPDAVVILQHLSYASGNASSGMPIPTEAVAIERIDNFANGFLAIGARVVFALGWQSGSDIIDALHAEDATMEAIFQTRYRDPVHPANGWIGHGPKYIASVRTPGAEVLIDPHDSYGYLRGITGELTFTSTEWRGSGSPPDDTTPPVLSELTVRDGDGTTVAIGDADKPVFTPNGDGLGDLLTIGHKLSESAFLDIRVTKGGNEVRRWSQFAVKGRGATRWDGRRDDGEYVGEGTFRLTYTPRDRAGNTGDPVFVRTLVLSSLKAPDVSPALFYPSDEDGLADVARFKARLTRPATVRWLVRDADGRIVRRGIDDTEFEPGPVKWAWDGRDDEGRPLPRGTYTARVRIERPLGSYGHDVTVRLQPFRLRSKSESIRMGRSMPITIRSAEGLEGKPAVTVKQRGVRTYPVKVKRASPGKFKITVTAKREGRKGPLHIVVTGTDVGGGEQSQRFVLTVR